MKFEAALDRVTLDDMVALEEDTNYRILRSFLAKFVQYDDGRYVAEMSDDGVLDDESAARAEEMIGRMNIAKLLEVSQTINAQIEALQETINSPN